jgi:hypothetical protein
MNLKFLSFSNLTLLVALSLSSVAAWYSIIGLTAIFAGAVIPVIIMGGILEVGKITTTVWLRKYWHRASWVLKLYLVPAVIALALLTSMGIFGFLSKAHMEHGLNTGDSQAKLSLYDEKIKTQRDNIELARKALTQMDNQVDQRLSRGDSENSAERAVQIRRQQAGERTKLQKEIGDAQKEIAKLNEERAPIAAENRKVEAEVGPIKYIAALIYGDSADNNTLEAAVRWVIILLVIVFDPLAIALVLAANASREWDKEEGDSPLGSETSSTPTVTEPEYEPDDGPLTDEQIEQIKDSVELPNSEVVPEEKSILESHPYLFKPFNHFTDTTPIVGKPESVESSFKIKSAYNQANAVVSFPDLSDIKLTPPVVEPTADSTDIVTEGVTKTIKEEKPYKELEGGYVVFDGKHMHRDVLKDAHPEFFRVKADGATPANTGFGTSFPKEAKRGDIFVRVDTLPNRVYKFDGDKWIEVRKEQSDTYLHDEMYIQHLITKIDSGEYDVELLTETEREQIAEYLRQNPKTV